ncbi:MAG: DnaJ domain-containing protein [Bacteroidia bacterium]|nr:DnaJ domain-containing protein [Bacteroidia bacterium]
MQFNDLDFFAFYQLPRKYFLTADEIRKRYLEISRNVHPDFYSNTTNTLQVASENIAAINNVAYKTLSNPSQRLEHLFKLYGLESQANELSKDFLMQVMEIHDWIESGQTEKAKTALASWNAEIQEAEKQILQRFDTADEEVKQVILAELLPFHEKKKYLKRIADRISS